MMVGCGEDGDLHRDTLLADQLNDPQKRGAASEVRPSLDELTWIHDDPAVDVASRHGLHEEPDDVRDAYALAALRTGERARSGMTRRPGGRRNPFGLPVVGFVAPDEFVEVEDRDRHDPRTERPAAGRTAVADGLGGVVPAGVPVLTDQRIAILLQALVGRPHHRPAFGRQVLTDRYRGPDAGLDGG